ncbi:MAG: glycine cleavage system aminomethyltransferase GcvT [Actinobacteria bacterium]|nr:glycine cleavage system aminomethyltransferase GcvT [Actinomycetota bacterium]
MTDARYSPLHDLHVGLGASFTDFAGWQMPVRYDSDLAEHHAVRERVGMFDISHMAEISVTGSQAGEFLDFAVAGKMSALALGQAKYTLLLTEAGTVIDDLIIYRLGDEHWLVVANAGNRFAALDALKARVAGFSVNVVDQSDETAMIAVQGPSALAVLESTVGLSLSDTAAERPQTTLADLKYYWTLPAVFFGHPVLIARTGYTGEDGFELYIDSTEAAALWTALAQAGEDHGIVPCGLACRDTLRLEAGMPLYGHELTLDIRPAQAGLGKVVALSKEGDFVGRSASEKDLPADARVLVALVGDGKRAARADYEVFVGDDKVGIVTSGALSPTLGFPIALAYVHPSHAAEGSVVDVDVRGTRIPFTVSTLPFYRRKKD